MSNKSIKKNMLMNIILTMSNFLFPLITYGYVSRVLTPVGVGKVSFVYSIIQYFSYIATLGIPAYGLREAAKVRDDREKLSKLVQELMIINVISTLVSLLLLFFSVLLVQKLYDYRILFLIMSSYIVLNTIGLEWLYNALEEYSYITIRSLIFKIIYIPLVFLLIKGESDYIYYGFMTIFVTSANYICNFINVKKYINFKRISRYELKKHIKPILILFSASIIISVYANFDIIMIGVINGEYSVGLYNTALKIKSIVLSLSTAVTTVFIPRISNYLSKKDIEGVQKLILSSFKTSMILALPIVIYVFMFSENVILFISGNEYLGAVSTLKVLMLCVLFLIMTNLFGNQLLIPLGKEKRFTRSVLIGLFINLGLNLALIPKYNSFGAAIGTLVTECWNMIYMAGGVKEFNRYIIKNAKIYKYIASVSLASISSILISILIKNINNFSFLLITGMIYMIVYYFTLFVLKEDIIINNYNKILKRKQKNIG